MYTVKNILYKISDSLSGARIENSDLESRIILSHCLNCSVEKLIINQDDLVEYSHELELIINERILRKPIAYILGYKEFYGRNFLVNEHVLIPRPDTETLINAVLSNDNNNINILELGVGSGCIIISLLLEIKHSQALGVDISENALNITMKNSRKYNCQDRLTLIKSDWYENIDPSNQFDIIISNPPYIKKSEMNLMSEETIIYEPHIALYDDLYSSYKKIAQCGKDYLNPAGEIYLEIGINQEADIIKIFLNENYILKNQFLDLGKILRVLVFGI